MNSLNSILIEGNMVRDPMFKVTSKGTPLCTFSVASNRFYKHDDNTEKEVSFFDIESWSELAKSTNERGKKGRGVRVVGRLKQDRWVDDQGKPHAKVKIIADHIEFRPEFHGQKAQDAAISTASGDTDDNDENEFESTSVKEKQLAEAVF